MVVPLDDTMSSGRRRHRSESFSFLITNSGTPITKMPHTDVEAAVTPAAAAADDVADINTSVCHFIRVNFGENPGPGPTN